MTKPAIAVGDKVRTDFHHSEAGVVRRVTFVEEDPAYGSGWAASADGGEACCTCGRGFATPIHRVDSTWFKRVEAEGSAP